MHNGIYHSFTLSISIHPIYKLQPSRVFKSSGFLVCRRHSNITMVFLTISKQITGLIGPFLFRNGIRARNVFVRISNSTPTALTPYLDMAVLIPYAQKLMSLTVYDESQQAISDYYKEKAVASSSSSSASSGLKSTFDALLGNKPPRPETPLEATKEQVQDENMALSDIRISVLESELRPALLPNETWSDVASWRWNFPVVKWARMEFLVSKYGPSIKVR